MSASAAIVWQYPGWK